MTVTVVHYVNQFFGGIGGEERADQPPIHRAGPVGPGLALASRLGPRARIAGTLICGDNYFVEHQDEAVAALLELARGYGADVLVAGPAFASGRHGTACAALCLAWQKSGRPAVTAMHPDNPGADLARSEVHVVRTGTSAASMNDALARLAALALKLGEGAPIGSALDEGYLPRGIRSNVRLERGAGERAVDMLLAKLAGRPYRSELVIEPFAAVAPADPVPDLGRALVALVSESGVVPSGNPDRLETWNASKWMQYPVAGRDRLEPGAYEVFHGGYDTAGSTADPNRAVPLDAARLLEREGTIGRLHDTYYVTTGNMGNLKTMMRLGAEIAQDMKAHGVQAAILTAT
jgi:glycine reductase